MQYPTRILDRSADAPNILKLPILSKFAVNSFKVFSVGMQRSWSSFYFMLLLYRLWIHRSRRAPGSMPLPSRKSFLSNFPWKHHCIHVTGPPICLYSLHIRTLDLWHRLAFHTHSLILKFISFRLIQLDFVLPRVEKGITDGTAVIYLLIVILYISAQKRDIPYLQQLFIYSFIALLGFVI